MRPLILSASAFLLFTGLANAQPDSAEICLFEEEDWAAVLSACTDAIAASESPVERGRFILHRGLAQEQLGDLEAALLDQLLAAEYRPDWFAGYSNAASLAFDMGDLEGEARWAQAAIDAEPENARAYQDMLVVTNNSGDPASCEPYADRVISLLRDPIDWAFDVSGSPYLMGNLGYCLHWVGRHDEALQAYLAAEYLGLDEKWLFSNLGRLSYYDLEEDWRAIAAATRALTYEDPNPSDVYVLVAANLYLDEIEAARDAEALYSDLLDTTDGTEGARNFLGWRLFLEGEIETAGDVMARWEATLNADDPTPNGEIASAWDTVAHIRAALGDADGAVSAFEASLAREPEDTIAERHETYRTEMEALGIDVAEGEEGLMAGLTTCAAMGAACRLFFDDDDVAQEALEPQDEDADETAETE